MYIKNVYICTEIFTRFCVCIFQLHASATVEPNNLMSVINLTDLAIKRIIKMTKQITPFINMCQEDQIALLKGGCTELMILRSLISYNPEKNSWSVSYKGNNSN